MTGTPEPTLLSMSAAMKATGLTARQLRYYEQKGLLKPARTKGNQRLYTTAEIDRLRSIKRLLEEGVPLEALRKSLTFNPAAVPDRETDNLSDAEQWFGRVPPGILYPSPDRERLARWLENEGLRSPDE